MIATTWTRLTGALSRRLRLTARMTILGLAVALAQAGGQAQAQLNKALRELAAQEAAEAERTVFVRDESLFNQWIYGTGIRNGSISDQLDARLMTAIEDLDRSCTLSEVQKRKLILAGHGDIKRFRDRVAEAHRTFDRFRNDPDATDEIIQQTNPLASEYGIGLHGDGSFFVKAIPKILTPEQVERRRAADSEKLKFRQMAKTTLILAALDARVGFTSDQHSRYLALILHETTPTKRPGSLDEDEALMVKIARLPEAKVRPIFDDSQWKRLDRIFRKARIREDSLRAEGLLD